MSRSSTWRRSPSDAASWHQDEALRATIFLLRELGPTRFVLREEGESRSVTVSLGDPHTCSCPVFQREKDLCKHVCWYVCPPMCPPPQVPPPLTRLSSVCRVLLKKFQLPRENDYAFQLGLVEREISQLLLGAHRARTPRVTPKCSEQKAGGDGLLQKKIDPEDVCPVCQEVLLQKRLPVSYCRYGCGNSVHITCMKVWAEHQATADRDAMVKCPLCREDFAPLKLLLEEVRNSSKLMSRAEKERQDRHLGIVCQGCQVCPVVGKCFRWEALTRSSAQLLVLSFVVVLIGRQRPLPQWNGITHLSLCLPSRCTACSGYYLCEPCFQKRCHPLHSFTYRLFHTSCIDQWLTSTSSSCPLDGQEVCTPPTWAQPNNGEESRAQQDLFVPGRGLLLGSPAGGQRASKRLVKPREMAGQHHAGQEGLCQGLRGVALCVEVLPPGRRHSRECRQ
ncbi:ZSWM2 ligase, partial [Polypterus senegalus]